ncbi:uncharacterized protein LOC132381329 isoform X2 [Hypanus sabinus]|uniref:uncharacterized protein LOC132381329 isoform X2 n=1 Tax=Hypanus sabinus TaxID=79690 RepID=UPI0028C387C1|nr:uncharacterized protein LOC132381329 isoform X2 [Hypanus sabinus]
MGVMDRKVKERNIAQKPSVYFLRPSAQEAIDKRVPAACLATDYLPNKYTLNISAGSYSEKRSEKDAQISIQDKSYSLLAFLTAPWSSVSSQMSCRFNETDYVDKGGQGVCIELDDDDEDERDVQELSLTVFGLRILFFKSVIFNILMSVRVWIS